MAGTNPNAELHRYVTKAKQYAGKPQFAEAYAQRKAQLGGRAADAIEGTGMDPLAFYAMAAEAFEAGTTVTYGEVWAALTDLPWAAGGYLATRKALDALAVYCWAMDVPVCCRAVVNAKTGEPGAGYGDCIARIEG